MYGFGIELASRAAAAALSLCVTRLYEKGLVNSSS